MELFLMPHMGQHLCCKYILREAVHGSYKDSCPLLGVCNAQVKFGTFQCLASDIAIIFLITPPSAKEQAEEAIPGLQKVVAVTLAYTHNSGRGNTALLHL